MEVELYQMIGTVGFPIAVSVFLLLKFDKTISENTKATQELTNFLKKGV